jgi:hypothetical protein
MPRRECWQDQRPPGRLREVEVVREVAENRQRLAHVGARVCASVRLRVEALPAQEVVFDGLRVGVEAQRLVVDVAASRVRADHDAGHAQAVAGAVDARRVEMVVEAAPVVPREQDRGRQRPVPRRDEEAVQRLDLPELPVLANRREVRQRIPDAGRARALRRRIANRRVVGTNGLPSLSAT